MPGPEQQADDELLERAKRLAGQFSDPRIVTLLSALVIADAIHRGIVRTSCPWALFVNHSRWEPGA
jgi:hypothetical protein